MSPLTPQQRELAAQNVGLVKVQVSRQLQRLPVRVRRREREDLVQAGMLGLMRAAANYLPDRHGLFSSYCVKYIHGALCRHLLRQMDGLAVPTKQAVKVIRHRRQAKVAGWRRAQDLPGEDPGTAGLGDSPGGQVPLLPYFFDLHTSSSSVTEVACRLAREAVRAEADDQPAGGRGGWTSRELHERYVQALEWAVGKVKATPSAHIDHAALVQAVVEERLRVPDHQFRTARRALATRFGCSPTRVWNVEVRIFRLVRRRLAEEAGLSQEAATLVYRGSSFRGLAEAPPDAGGPSGCATESAGERRLIRATDSVRRRPPASQGAGSMGPNRAA